VLSYASAVAELYELGHELAQTSGRKFDLELVRVLLRALGHPERSFPSVLIAGTNGKGSTAATLASIVRAAGHRTALYTSPHLLRLNERIKLDDREISDAAFAEVYGRVKAAAQNLLENGKLPWRPSFFEMLTAMAFLYFAEARCALAVIEVGMGGRLDATNVTEPLLSVITDISLDHEKFLGHTIREIAREKAGIMRPGRPVILLPQHPEANEALGNAILRCGARPVNAGEYVPRESSTPSALGRQPPGAWTPETGNCYPLEVRGEQIMVFSPLPGRHQWRNLALAIAAAVELNSLGIPISCRQIEAGIPNTRWPGRFEVLPACPERNLPEMVFDVAHNPAGAWALRAALSERYSTEDSSRRRPLIMVFGAMRDKAIGEMASILFPLADHVIAASPENPRAASPEEIRELGHRISRNIECAASVPAGLERACRLAGTGGVVVVTGSIYTVAEAKKKVSEFQGFKVAK
jgi:dihydrofolate synthase/folylpolyglutamate synthase